MKRRTAAIILAILGIGMILIPFHVAMTGICLLALAAVLVLLDATKGKKHEKMWHTILISLTIFCMAAVLGGMIVIALDGRDDVPETDKPDFVVVLGAQVQSDHPSLTLKKRLDRAKTYLDDNPQAVVFVSGGQGPDEAYTEAGVMEAYLLRAGVEPSRIFREEAASNTRENLLFSRQIADSMGIRTDRVLIITSEYHLCRAKYIARTVGLEPYGLGSDTWPKILEVNYLLREVFAFVKAWAVAGF